MSGDLGFTHMEGLVNLEKLVGRGRFRFIGFPLKIRAAPGARSARWPGGLGLLHPTGWSGARALPCLPRFRAGRSRLRFTSNSSSLIHFAIPVRLPLL